MIFVYRPRNSVSARELAEGITLLGTLARRTRGQRLRNLTAGDKVVCWGSHFAAPAGIQTLNNQPPKSKYQEALALKAAGVPTVEVSQTRPRAAAAVQPVRGNFAIPAALNRAELSEAQARALLNDINTYLTRVLPPAQPAETWLARMNNHVGGNDLLQAIGEADYYSKKEDIVEEYRLHIFRGKSQRAGKKFKNPTRPDGRTPAHEWIRSYDGGWVIKYDGFESTRAMRDLAKKAVKALSLDFAAVDIAKKRDGSLIVLEVNRAPGLEGNTTIKYAQNVINWANGTDREEE